MLPKNFDFAMLPPNVSSTTLKEIGMLSSTIESIDQAFTNWVKDDVNISTMTHEGFIRTPVLWQVPERAYQVKNKKELRDDGGALKLPLITVERTGVVKDPAQKGSFQANLYSNKHNGRSGRMVIAKQIVQDKTRNFAAVPAMRDRLTGGTEQLYFPRVNKKVVIRTLSIPIPVYVNINYKITLKSEYQQQMNTMLQPFMTRTGQVNAFVIERNGHRYEGFIDQNFNSSNNVENLGEDIRTYTSEINVRILGYLIGEGESDDRPLVEIHENAVEVTFPNEAVVPDGNDDFFL